MAEHTELDIYEIDYDAKDVFETSDIDDNVPEPPSAETSRRSSIEILQSEPQDARKVFENLMVDTCKAHFSDKIDSKSASMAGYRVEETYEQKLMRIRRELEELELVQSATGDFVDAKSEVSSLLSRVNDKLKLSGGDKSGESDKSVESGDKSVERGVKNDLTISEPCLHSVPTHTTKPLINADLIADLDSRISQLETTLGDSSSLDQHGYLSVQALINDLYRKLSLVSNQDYLRNEVRPIVDNLKRVSDNKNVLLGHLQSQQDAQSLDEHKMRLVYDKLGTLANYESLLPKLLNRLKSLHTLNMELSRQVTTEGEHQDRIFVIENSLGEWELQLQKMETSLHELEGKSVQNREAMETWLRDLEVKVGKMSSV